MSDAQLRELGMKVTVPRLKILTILESGRQRHWSAEAIYDQLRAQESLIGLATVYRVLTQFESAGLVTRHYFEGQTAVFELNEAEHHDHIVCIKCGKVAEFVDDIIENRQIAIAEQNGFQITDHSMVIYGFCRSCQAAPVESS